MFYQAMDVIKYLFTTTLIIFTLSGKAQQLPDSLRVILPDTSLSPENTLFLVEKSSDVYFSYNPEIFSGELTMDWESGEYYLKEIIDRICDPGQLLYTLIGNQVVFYKEGQELATGPIDEEIPVQFVPRKIKGLIRSAGEGGALAFATIWIPSTLQGTIANSEGYFLMTIPPGVAADTLAISCMGYGTTFIPIDNLGDSLITIFLEASIIPIQEVVIRRTEPLNLLRLALKIIPDNYSADPVIETAFYRETIRKNNQYIAVSEAVLDIYKPGFDAVATEQTRVLRGRKNMDYSEMDTLVVKLKGGLETSYLLDIIRNRPDFLQPEQFHRYEYRMSDIVTIQDKSTYAIDFVQKESTTPPHFRGRIYIDLETLALRGAEFEVNPKTISSMSGSMVYKKPRKIKVRPVSASYMVRYKSDGNKFYLSLIRADNRFRIRPRKKLFGDEFRTLSELAVTHLELEEVARFRTRETANTSDIFSEMLGGYDPGFWGPYNYLVPEESLEDALIRIAHLMENH